MGLYEILPDEINEVDVIVAGGGTTGCIIASRLSDADPKLSILVVERGPNNRNVPTCIYPSLFLAGIIPTSKATLFYKGEKESQLGGRELTVPSGGTLGGGSSICFMAYTRAQRSDYDSWETAGWSSNDLIPYMKKFETYHGPDPHGVHGSDGPIDVSRGVYSAPRSESDFVQAAAKVGYPEIEDLTILDANNGVQRGLRYIGKNGRRQDAAHKYLHPRLEDGKHPNLHVIVDSQVKRILFDNKRASGIEYLPNPETHPEAGLRTVRARKMVIVTCGALATPSVLERSGVGNPEILQKAGISEVTSDLPGVGANLQDHHLLTYPYRSTLNPKETGDAITSGRVNVPELIMKDDPYLGWNFMDIHYKLRPTNAEVTALGSKFQKAWDEEFRDSLDKPLIMGSLISGFPGDPSVVPVGQYYALSVFTAYPYSRGSIHITGPEMGDKVELKTGFFSDVDEVDLKKHVWGYKKHREIFRRMETYRGEIEGFHPPFAADSSAALVQLEEGVVLDQVRDINYTKEDDKVIEEWLRARVETTWHSLGTCKMAPRDKGGVVDPSLSVYGVEGLKVADLSIPPLNVAANTMNTAMTIGEKAADIFIREMGLESK